MVIMIILFVMTLDQEEDYFKVEKKSSSSKTRCAVYNMFVIAAYTYIKSKYSRTSLKRDSKKQHPSQQ